PGRQGGKASGPIDHGLGGGGLVDRSRDGLHFRDAECENVVSKIFARTFPTSGIVPGVVHCVAELRGGLRSAVNNSEKRYQRLLVLWGEDLGKNPRNFRPRQSLNGSSLMGFSIWHDCPNRSFNPGSAASVIVTSTVLRPAAITLTPGQCPISAI